MYPDILTGKEAEIYDLFQVGWKGVELAKKYGVSTAVIWDVLNAEMMKRKREAA